LASNGWSRVQALAVERGAGRFWAVQYHPEYDLHEVASLCRLRADELAAQASFESREAAERYAEQLDRLHGDPSRRDLAEALGIEDGLLDAGQRTREVANWLASVRPGRASAG
jgi:GMP synthase (glutamine-hydrolysing)